MSKRKSKSKRNSKRNSKAGKEPRSPVERGATEEKEVAASAPGESEEDEPSVGEPGEREDSSEGREASSEEPEAALQEPLHPLQKLMDNPWLLLVLGILIPFLSYTLWGFLEMVLMPPAKLP